MITETGAEANRSGPVEEKGTYEFQQDYINYHYAVYATKPWLSGALYWALKEFRVRPEWEGGNPRPQPPIHQKGVVAFDGTRKPGYTDLQRCSRATDQYPGPVAPARRSLSSTAVMANVSTTLEVTTRDIEGSRANRRLRRSGRIPAVIYGGGDEPPADQRRRARAAPRAPRGGRGARALARRRDAPTPCSRTPSADPVRGDLWHVDFLRVRMDVAIQSTVTLELTGAEEAPGTTEGGVLEQQLRELSIEALPGDIPENITLRRLGARAERHRPRLRPHRARRA